MDFRSCFAPGTSSASMFKFLQNNFHYTIVSNDGYSVAAKLAYIKKKSSFRTFCSR